MWLCCLNLHFGLFVDSTASVQLSNTALVAYSVMLCLDQLQERVHSIKKHRNVEPRWYESNLQTKSTSFFDAKKTIMAETATASSEDTGFPCESPTQT